MSAGGRGWSTYGRVVTKGRSLLDFGRVDKLVRLNFNKWNFDETRAARTRFTVTEVYPEDVISDNESGEAD